MSFEIKKHPYPAEDPSQCLVVTSSFLSPEQSLIEGRDRLPVDVWGGSFGTGAWLSTPWRPVSEGVLGSSPLFLAGVHQSWFCALHSLLWKRPTAGEAEADPWPGCSVRQLHSPGDQKAIFLELCMVWLWHTDHLLNGFSAKWPFLSEPTLPLPFVKCFSSSGQLSVPTSPGVIWLPCCLVLMERQIFGKTLPLIINFQAKELFNSLFK